jgi:hypothetical protein
MRRLLLTASLLVSSLFAAFPAAASFGTINASPTVVSIPSGSTLGTTTISWEAYGADIFYVGVNCGGGNEGLFASSGPGTASQEAPWIQVGSFCTFLLRAGSPNGTLLNSVSVVGVGPSGSMSASPQTVVIPPGSVSGTTTIFWEGVNDSYFVVTGQCGGSEVPFASSGPGPNSQSASWIVPGQTCVFRLRAGSAYGPEVANTTVYGVAGQAVSGSIAASPETITIPWGQYTGSTLISWSSNASTTYVMASCYGQSPYNFATAGAGNYSLTAGGFTDGTYCTFELRANSPTGDLLDSVTVTAQSGGYGGNEPKKK